MEKIHDPSLTFIAYEAFIKAFGRYLKKQTFTWLEQSDILSKLESAGFQSAYSIKQFKDCPKTTKAYHREMTSILMGGLKDISLTEIDCFLDRMVRNCREAETRIKMEFKRVTFPMYEQYRNIPSFVVEIYERIKKNDSDKSIIIDPKIRSQILECSSSVLAYENTTKDLDNKKFTRWIALREVAYAIDMIVFLDTTRIQIRKRDQAKTVMIMAMAAPKTAPTITAPPSPLSNLRGLCKAVEIEREFAREIKSESPKSEAFLNGCAELASKRIKSM